MYSHIAPQRYVDEIRSGARTYVEINFFDDETQEDKTY
jgi:hypothetical protein